MDDQNNDPSDNSNENNEIIVNGLFGITGENDADNNAVHSDCSDDLDCIVLMKDGKTIANLTLSDISEKSDCNNTAMVDIENCITIDDDTCNAKHDDCAETSKSKSFGSHILCTSSKDSDHPEIPSSFATVTENYEKLRDVASEVLVLSPANEDQVSELDSKSSVVLPKGNLPSTLSMISMNYQDSTSSSDDSDTSSDDEKLNDSDNENSVISVSSEIIKEDRVKTKGELDISDLPPIEDLKISVDEAKCLPVGCIKSIVDTLVVVETFLNQPALDIDSVLFVDRGQRALGKIFDVFGPVSKPYYAVRFNNSNHIKKFDIKIKEPVYCAPQTEYTSYVMVSQLLKIKGSDASWKHNNEPPPECIDYSDDEAERLAKKQRKKKKRSNDEDPEDEGDKSPNPSTQNVARNRHTASNKPNKPNISTTIRPQSSSQPSYRPQQTYSPRPANYSNYAPGPSGNSPRPFPTYAQHLSAMEYSQSYRQPYNPWYYNQTYAPRQNYPYQQHPCIPPPGYDYQSPQQTPINPDDPSRYNYPNYAQQPPMNPDNSNRYNYPDRNYR